jgi:phage gp16-like protein
VVEKLHQDVDVFSTQKSSQNNLSGEEAARINSQFGRAGDRRCCKAFVDASTLPNEVRRLKVFSWNSGHCQGSPQYHKDGGDTLRF